MSNPWLKKNPFMSMWLSGAHTVANAARGSVAAEAKRQSNAAIKKATRDVLGGWGGSGHASPVKKRKKKNRFPGV